MILCCLSWWPILLTNNSFWCKNGPSARTFGKFMYAQNFHPSEVQVSNLCEKEWVAREDDGGQEGGEQH